MLLSLRNTTAHFPNPVLTHKNPVYSLISQCFNIRFNIILYLRLDLNILIKLSKGMGFEGLKLAVTFDLLVLPSSEIRIFS